MPAIEILYGGNTYHVTDRTVAELKTQIETASAAGGGWVVAVDGGGPAHLYVSRGVEIALLPTPDEPPG